MKKAFFLFISLIIVSVTCFATVPADHPQLANYFAARFISLDHQGQIVDLDLKEVQSIVVDTHGHISLEYAPTNPGVWGKGGYWIIFKNGGYILSVGGQNIIQKWRDYRNILQANPQFLSIP